MTELSFSYFRIGFFFCAYCFLLGTLCYQECLMVSATCFVY